MAEHRFPYVEDPRRSPIEGKWLVRVRRSPTDVHQLDFDGEEEALSAIEGLNQALDILLPGDPLRPDRGSIKAQGLTVAWTQNLVAKSEAFPDATEALHFAAELEKLVGPEGVRKIPEGFAGRPEEWRSLITDAARALNEATVAGATEESKIIYKYIGVLLNLYTAYKGQPAAAAEQPTEERLIGAFFP